MARIKQTTVRKYMFLPNTSTAATHQYLIWEGIVDRDAMTPPQLSTDAPVLDVFKPSVVYFLKPFWHNLDVATADSLQRRQQSASMQTSQCGKSWPARLLMAYSCVMMMTDDDW